MSKVKKLKEIQVVAEMSVAKEPHVSTALHTYEPSLRYIVKREPTFWNKGIKVLQFHNGVEWLDVPKVRTVK